MRLVLHPKVHSDIDMIMDYYEAVATPKLASEFYAELRHLMTKAAAFCIVGDVVRVLVVRHYVRHPSLGGGRG